jgi:lipoprotein-anchoring transpeptidase ErfK/SrfK
MMHRAALISTIVGAVLTGPALGHELTARDINDASLISPEDAGLRAVVLKAQVMLDRSGFSIGAIDGRVSGNLANALRAFQLQNELEPDGELDPLTWARLIEVTDEPPLREYVITAEDMRGPFRPDTPGSYDKMAKLKRLDFTGPAELLAERFHMDEDLLRELNVGKAFDRGTSIVVANVRLAAPETEVTRLVVEKARRSVRAYDRDGRLVAFYPASLGGDDKPTPSGTLKITRVVRDPVYIYDPRFRFADVDAQSRLKIGPGPNNPVGSVWMNLNQRSYGIHGTAEPGKVGRVKSHGCVRLTNWDARMLAAMVRKGTTVEFLE